MGPHSPQSPQSPQSDLFRARLDEQINMKHPLVRLAGLIDWDEIHRTFGGHFSSGRGRPALSPRLVAGLLYLQHAFDASDEAVVGTWVADARPKIAIVDKGYQGVKVDGVRILRSGQKRGLTRTLHAMVKRRSAIEPAIGHMKSDGRFARNPLKGAIGDALHALMCGAGHNIRLLLKKLRLLRARIADAVHEWLAANAPPASIPMGPVG